MTDLIEIKLLFDRRFELVEDGPVQNGQYVVRVLLYLGLFIAESKAGQGRNRVSDSHEPLALRNVLEGVRQGLVKRRSVRQARQSVYYGSASRGRWISQRAPNQRLHFS